MIADRIVTASDSALTVWRSVGAGMRSGGDWCEIIPVSDGVVAVTIGDVAGHGTAAAAAMEAMRAAIRSAFAAVRVPSMVLALANQAACAFGDGVIVTAIVAVIDESELTLTFANAGHPPPLLLTGTADAFIASGVADIPLGIFAQHRAADYVIALPADALLVFYTDGITEHKRDPLAGERELVKAARAVYPHRSLNAARGIARRVFAGNRGSDDAAAICLRTPRARRPRSP